MVDEAPAPSSAERTPRILLTGATGYVGGRLRRRLEEAGHQLRCMARHPNHLLPRVGPDTEVVRGDVQDRESLHHATRDCDIAFYLVHSMGSRGNFEDQDRSGARNFARAARRNGVRRIIYLGGLGNEHEELSPHLRSRIEVGRVLREEHPEVIELRASVVIGSGSLSFDLIRALVERLPVMITPQWTTARAQPIAIRDLQQYLEHAMTLPGSGSRTYEIGGADVTTYEQLMREYARQRGLRRVMLRVPVISPRLSSLWLGLVTPVYARIGRKLIESIRHQSVVEDARALEDFSIRPAEMSTAIARALANEERRFVESRWFDSLSSGGEIKSWAGTRFGNRIADRRAIWIPAPPDVAFRPIEEIGGRNGWYAFNWLWQLRGTLDLLLGGVGMRRGRPHPRELEVGDALDFWRVEAFAPSRLLRLHAEMKVPGRAWLEFEVKPENGGSRISQTALFDPVGLSGLAYWYLIYPLHLPVFQGMLKAIGRRAESLAKQPRPPEESPAPTSPE